MEGAIIMLISEVVKLLEALNEEQLVYIYTYIKEYFDIDVSVKKTVKIQKP